MDSSAVRAIEELVARNTVLPTPTPAVLVPQHCVVTSLERQLARPTRMRATFTTTHTGDFIRYLARHGSPGNTAISVECPPKMSAFAILDYGSPDAPGWGDHIATLRLTPTPAFCAFQQISKEPISQRALMEYLEDWADELTASIAGAPIPLPKALAALRKIDIRATSSRTTEELEHKASRSVLEQIEINEGSDTLPDYLTLNGPAYYDTRSVSIRIRLVVRPNKTDASFLLRPVNLERVQVAIADELAERIRSEAPFDLYLGDLASKQAR